MSVFKSSYSLEKRMFEWVIQDPDYDYKQEIARSGYADMLWDQERNDKYFKAIKTCVFHLKKNNKEVHVLDIGTGTGLLSMMAASLGVDSITACEAFYPMYKCANEILIENSCRSKIKLIPKRSTELEVGPGKDMLRKANLLVAELLDTELIGEGAIEIYMHAKEYLLEEDALLVPTSATVYAQLVSSEAVLNWNKLKDLEYSYMDQKLVISIPSEITSCHGYEFHDIQMSELSLSEFEPKSDPVPVCKLDWTGRDIPLKKFDGNVTKVKLKKNCAYHAVFMWWDIDMESITHDILSCAPYWAHPLNKGSSKDIPWRDHWMQAVYFLPKILSTKEDQNLSLITYHDSHSFWFDIDSSLEVAPKVNKPMCQCYLHLTISGNRMAQLNNAEYNNFFAKILNQQMTSDSVCLFIGDLCLHAIYAIKIGAKHVYLTKLPFHNEILEKIISENKMEDHITFLPGLNEISEINLSEKINFVFGEPYFSSSFLPWENLHFWKITQSIKHLCSPSVKVLPDKCEIKCVPVQFRDLWKIHSPVKSTCGFNLRYFDQVIMEARLVDDNVEPKSLWEYPCVSLGPEISLITLDMTAHLNSDQLLISKNILKAEGAVNGIVIWTDWLFGEERYSTGPVTNTKDKFEWNPFVKQGVYFPDYTSTDDNFQINVATTFNPQQYTCHFNFEDDVEVY